MSKKQTIGIARTAYESALEELRKLSEDGANVAVQIEDSAYPVRVAFYPYPQESLFSGEFENVSPEGEVGSMTVSVGISTVVKSTLNFRIDARLLKKMIRGAEKVGLLYYQCFREAMTASREE